MRIRRAIVDVDMAGRNGDTVFVHHRFPQVGHAMVVIESGTTKVSDFPSGATRVTRLALFGSSLKTALARWRGRAKPLPLMVTDCAGRARGRGYFRNHDGRLENQGSEHANNLIEDMRKLWRSLVRKRVDIC